MARPKFLTKDTVKQIRKLYESSTFTQTELAKRFLISQSTICKIVNNYIHRVKRVSGKAEVKVSYKYGN